MPSIACRYVSMSNARETANKLIEAWNNRDWDFIRGSLHPETALIMPDGQEIRGVEACLAEGGRITQSGSRWPT